MVGNLERHRQNININVNITIKNEKHVHGNTSKSVGKQIKNSGSPCFPGCSKVWLKNGIRVYMRDLKVGDQVLVRNSKGHLSYSKVYMFGHHDPDTYGPFVVLTTKTGEVRVSEKHYLFCLRDGQEICMTAGDTKVGDLLLGLSSLESQTLEHTVIQAKRVEQYQGLYAPFTLEGTIVVDDHLMSCYVQCVSHNTAHLLLSPIRQLYRISPQALGIVNNLGSSKDESSVPWWARVALKCLKNQPYVFS